MKKALTILSLCAVAAASLCCSCSAKVRHYRLKVLEEYPHDPSAYTQGLFFHDGKLYESTGQYGSSSFRTVDLATGKVSGKLDFARKYFVEGSVIMGDELFILTWVNKVAFRYDASTLEYRSSVAYPREGWGLTTDGKSLVASDGSANIYFMDRDFRTQRKITVTMNGRPVRFLNELEYIDGRIWANVYTTDMIVIINPDNGVVEAEVDCTGLLPASLRDADTDVLNGIASDGSGIYLTGKNWKRLYRVELVEK